MIQIWIQNPFFPDSVYSVLSAVNKKPSHTHRTHDFHGQTSPRTHDHT